MSDLPVPGRSGGEQLPERRVSSAELEAVIRRAIELQAGSAAGAEEISEAELLRIGHELGLSAASMRQAVAEVRARGLPEDGVLVRAFGPVHVAASRIIRLDAERAGQDLDRYFRECEHMAVQRRRPGWTVYERGSGVAAQWGRSLSNIKLLNVSIIEVAVEPMNVDSSYVSLAVDLAGVRAGAAAGTAVVGGVGGATVAAALGIAVAPPAALLGLPVLVAAWWGMRAAYDTTSERKQIRLESIIDRLESGELLPAPSTWRDTFKKLTF